MTEVKVRGVCHLDCPDTCGMISTVRDGVLVRVEGDPDHPITQGFLCTKVLRSIDRVYGKERVYYPMRRIGKKGEGRFARISWDGAVALIAERFKAILASRGPDALVPYRATGTISFIQGKIAGERFFNHLGASRQDFTICAKTGRVGYTYTVGGATGTDPLTIPQARAIITWGSNPHHTNIHGIPFINEARKAGAFYAVIDPHRTRSADAADLFLQPRPGTDAALALGMMHVLITEGLVDQQYVAAHTMGYEQLRERVLREYTPDRAAAICQVPVDDIVRLARIYGRQAPQFIYVGMGMQHHTNGGMTLRTLACLPGLVGAWAKPGGGMIYDNAGTFPVDYDVVAHGKRRPRAGRIVNMNQLGEILVSGNPPAHGLVVYNGNPAAALFNQNVVLAGLSRGDLFTVVLEQVFTETALYADVVLPATHQFEHWDLHGSYFHLFLQLNQPAIAPQGEAKPNLAIFNQLARAMDLTDSCFDDTELDIVRQILACSHPHFQGITLDDLMCGPVRLKTPEAVLGVGCFPTPSGKVEFNSEAMARDGFDPLPAYIPVAESPEASPDLHRKYPLYFLTPSGKAILNATFAETEVVAKMDGRPTIQIHPEDARARDIRSGDLVRVRNDRGECYLFADVCERVRPGVTVATGLWWNAQCPGGGNVNTTTPDRPADIGGGSTFHTNLVEVERVRDPAAVRAFDITRKDMPCLVTMPS